MRLRSSPPVGLGVLECVLDEMFVYESSVLLLLLLLLLLLVGVVSFGKRANGLEEDVLAAVVVAVVDNDEFGMDKEGM